MNHESLPDHGADPPRGTPIHGSFGATEGASESQSEMTILSHRPGQGVIIMLGLSLGLVLMALQLWLLTLAYDLYLAGKTTDTLIVALCSGGVFVGGLLMLTFVLRRPSARG